MGIDMQAGDRDLYASQARLVRDWCDPFEPRFTGPFDEWMGRLEFSPKTVAAAHAMVPLTFDQAKAQGFDGGLERDFWDHARDFLRHAHEIGKGITGSW